MWDDEINEAAQQETSGSLRRDFKARVLARLNDPDLERLPANRWAWIVAPVAVAAVFLIAVIVYRGNREIPTHTPSTATAAAPTDIELAVHSPNEPPDVPTTTRTERSEVVGLIPEMTSVDAAAIDSEAIAIAPLVIAPIRIDAMEMVEPDIQLLSLSEIDVSALDQ